MTKPDIDNLAKFYMDCLTGSVIQDDCQVFSLTLNKVYAETECTKIMITPVRALDSKELSENKSLADGWIDC
jgi:Holliday junction resolvase RusA-like endonuclease